MEAIALSRVDLVCGGGGLGGGTPEESVVEAETGGADNLLSASNFAISASLSTVRSEVNDLEVEWSFRERSVRSV